MLLYRKIAKSKYLLRGNYCESGTDGPIETFQIPDVGWSHMMRRATFIMKPLYPFGEGEIYFAINITYFVLEHVCYHSTDAYDERIVLEMVKKPNLPCKANMYRAA
jgi:hypothetical protein